MVRRGFERLGWVWAAVLVVVGIARGDEPAKPRLIVVVSVDQLCQEYLERMRPGFAADGFFNTVRKRGAYFRACHHGQAYTRTGPGHSVHLTGAYPADTGIIDNHWYDRDTGKNVYCVEDDDVRSVGVVGAEGMSPKNLEIGTLGDQLKLATNSKAKVFGVALKDRASILMAGHAADAAFWYDAKTATNSGNWISSTYYLPEDGLPGYLRAYNEARTARRKYGSEAISHWELLKPREAYLAYYDDASNTFEQDVKVLGRGFPHPLPSGDAKEFPELMPISYLGTDMTLEVAELVLREEKLGADDVCDLLCINLSSNDFCGHAYGPHSLEVQDITYRTDVQLARFTRMLDEVVGEGKWTIALSADHGVAPIPEFALTLKLPARRVMNAEFDGMFDRLEKRLAARFGKPATGGKYLLKVGREQTTNSVYLNTELAELAGERYSEAQAEVRNALLRESTVAAAFTRDELLAGNGRTELFERIQKSFHPRRSGDVCFCLKPYYIEEGSKATHGSPWEYDTHVPLLMLGCGVQAGVHDRMVSPPMMAPTLARIAGVDFPSGCTVKPLFEVLGEGK